MGPTQSIMTVSHHFPMVLHYVPYNLKVTIPSWCDYVFMENNNYIFFVIVFLMAASSCSPLCSSIQILMAIQ